MYKLRSSSLVSFQEDRVLSPTILWRVYMDSIILDPVTIAEVFVSAIHSLRFHASDFTTFKYQSELL